MVRFASVLVTTVVVLVLAAPAQATLRSPRLTSDCPNGYSYGERGFYALVVEGCAKEVDPEGSEAARVLYRGDVEVSGLIVEGSGDLIATTKRNSDGNEIGRVQRASTNSKVVMDPRIGDERRRVVLFTGAVDLRSESTVPSRFYIDPPFDVPPLTVSTNRQILASAHVAQTPTSVSRGSVDIRVNGGPSILGMRIRETIHDVRAQRSTSGNDTTGQLELDVTMSLGQLVPAVFRDKTSRVKLTVIDGGTTELDGLKLKLPKIAVPGIGGFKDLKITYNENSDLWSGNVDLDLGDLFPSLEFEMAVRGSDGGVNYIRTAANDLGIPIGNSGVFLDSIRAAFNLDPLWFSAGAGVRAGPTIGGTALITGNGDVRVDIEPRFKLAANARIEILPVGNGALATGSGDFLLDSAGYLSLSANARFEVAIAGVGIGASIGGSGAYATERNQFNIAAHANGQLLLGFLGDINVVRAKAVVSSDGWGTCTKIGFVSAGVGQNWRDNVQLFTNCDLSPYRTVVRQPGASAVGAGSQTFTVEPGTQRIAIEVTGQGPDPKLRLLNPAGKGVINSLTPGTRSTSKATVIARAGEAKQLFAVNKPAAGTWKFVWGARSEGIAEVKVARDVEPISATTTVTDKAGDRPGRRRIKVKGIRGLAQGEKVMLGVKTPTGVVPLGTVGSEGLDTTFDEMEAGDREIVATLVRNGVPLPERGRSLKRYRERLSGSAQKIERSRKDAILKVRAVARKGEEHPDAWQYTFSSKAGVFAEVTAKDGKRVTITLPNYQKRVKVTVRPVFHGRALKSGFLTADVK